MTAVNGDLPASGAAESGPSEGRDPLEALAEEFVERLRRGERPTISEYTERHPPLASRISALFPALIDIEEAGQPGSPAPGGPGPSPKRLGDYQVLREVARGGMGVVYEAEQISLGRRVALKVLCLRSLGDERLAERFRREARSAACLHHSNIVPVYGTGEADGALFYAMQFIDGRNLSEVLEEVRRQREVDRKPGGEPLRGRADPVSDSAASLTGSSSSTLDGGRSHYFRRVAGIGRQAAGALAYAHGEGVLHRDIKPSNLILDMKGNIWITDFGLAKAEGASELTHSGDVVGTIGYLAPERLDGWSDPRSDVYSLGITLYELLTLERAFPQSRRAEVLQAIARKDPVRPRKVDPTIPRDLETIVLKATDKNPAYRYVSAGEMAEDLGRFLEIRPISAKRTGAVHRTLRWCQRSPLAASLAATSLVLLAALAAGATIAAFRLQGERNNAAERLLDARIASARWRRQAGSAGQRFDTLRELKGIAAVRKDSDVATEAVASFDRFDFEVEKEQALEPSTTVVIMDPSLETYASVLKDGSVTIRRIEDASLVRRIGPAPGPSTRVHALRFSPSGALLGMGIEGAGPYQVRVVAAEDGHELLRAPSPGSRALALDFEPGERRVAIRGERGCIEVHSLADAAVGPLLLSHAGGHVPTSLSFDPSGKRLASVQSFGVPAVLIWEVERARIEKILVHGASPYQIAWHPEGKLLAVGCTDYLAYLWDVEAERIVRRHSGHRAEVVQISFSPDGKTLGTSSWDGESRFWDVGTGAAVAHRIGPFRAWGRDDRSAWFAMGARKVCKLRVAPDDARRVRFRITPMNKGPRALAISPEGDIVAAACEGEGLQAALTSGGAPWAVSTAYTKDVTFLPDGLGLLSLGDRVLYFPVERVNGLARFGSPRVVLEGGGDRIAISPDGQFVGSINPRGEVVLADLEGRTAPRRVGTVRSDVKHVAVTRGARWVATSRSIPPETDIFDGQTGERAHQFPWGGGQLEFSLDDRRLVACSSEAIQAVEVGSGKVLWSRPRQEGGGLGGSVAAFPGDARFMFASPSRAEIGLYEIETGREVVRFGLADGGHVSSLCLGRGSLGVGSAIDHVQVWDLSEVDRKLRDLGLELGLDLRRSPGAPAAASIEVPSRAGRIELDLALKWAWMEKLVGLTLLNLASPDSAEPYERRAEAFLEKGYHQESLADLERALERNPRRPALLIHRRAQALDGLGRVQECLQELGRALELDPALLDAYLLRGTVLDRLGREAEARRDLESVLVQSPDHADALEPLAWILLTGPMEARDPRRALELARKAAAKKSDLVYPHRTLGLACYRAGLLDEARAALERATAIRGGESSPSSLLVLSMARARGGDVAGARQALKNGTKALSEPDRRRRMGPSNMRRIEELRAEAEALLVSHP